MLDDPQTRESAESLSQNEQRLSIINGDVLGMAGPGQKIAGFAAVTVIQPGDMADSLLDREKSPQWQGERCKMLYSMPDDEKLWEEYGKLRAEGLRNGDKGAAGTAFYKRNRAAMDKGAEPAWPQRHDPDELSAIQHAMNIHLLTPAVFAAEYQNEPIPSDLGDGVRLTAPAILAKLNRMPCGLASANAEHLTTFIDVHDGLLYWMACAWSQDFDGQVIDYGTWPKQHRRYFLLRKATNTLAQKYPGHGIEAAIRAGLFDLTNELFSRQWEREDGAPLHITRGLVDAGYKWEVVTEFCRASPHAALLMPSRGIGIGAAGKPMTEYNRKLGDRIGFNWYIPKPTDGAKSRHFRFDSNSWKSFVAARILLPVGDKGALTFYGESPEEHRMLADHLLAEKPTRTRGHGRDVDEWRILPSKPDNHLFDCLTGCAAAASLSGAVPAGLPEVVAVRKRKHYTQADLRRRAA
jgi:hypothetical protein